MLTQRWFKIVLCLIAGTVLFQYCVQRSEPLFTDPRGMGYAGSAACISCHASTVAAYEQTAHHNTTLPANEKNIKGSFHSDSNSFHYRTDLEVVMEKKRVSFFRLRMKRVNKKLPFHLIL